MDRRTFIAGTSATAVAASLPIKAMPSEMIMNADFATANSWTHVGKWHFIPGFGRPGATLGKPVLLGELTIAEMGLSEGDEVELFYG